MLNVLYLPRDTKSKGRQVLNVDEITTLVESMKVLMVKSVDLGSISF